jgi:hypothetical protein
MVEPVTMSFRVPTTMERHFSLCFSDPSGQNVIVKLANIERDA